MRRSYYYILVTHDLDFASVKHWRDLDLRLNRTEEVSYQYGFLIWIIQRMILNIDTCAAAVYVIYFFLGPSLFIAYTQYM